MESCRREEEEGVPWRVRGGVQIKKDRSEVNKGRALGRDKRGAEEQQKIREQPEGWEGVEGWREVD